MNITLIQCHRGEVYIANLEPIVGSEQGGIRPVVVVQCDALNRHSPTVVVSPITSNIGKRPDFPTHVVCQHIFGLPRPSMVLVEQSRAIAKDRMRQRVGYLTEEQLCRAANMLANCASCLHRRMLRTAKLSKWRKIMLSTGSRPRRVPLITS